MSRGRPNPLLARRAAPARSLTDGACAPLDAQPIPQARCKVPVVTGGEKPKAILCASPDEICGLHQSDQKTAFSRIGRANPLLARRAAPARSLTDGACAPLD